MRSCYLFPSCYLSPKASQWHLLSHWSSTVSPEGPGGWIFGRPLWDQLNLSLRVLLNSIIQRSFLLPLSERGPGTFASQALSMAMPLWAACSAGQWKTLWLHLTDDTAISALGLLLSWAPFKKWSIDALCSINLQTGPRILSLSPRYPWPRDLSLILGARNLTLLFSVPWVFSGHNFQNSTPSWLRGEIWFYACIWNPLIF